MVEIKPGERHELICTSSSGQAQAATGLHMLKGVCVGQVFLMLQNMMDSDLEQYALIFKKIPLSIPLQALETCPPKD
jgi:hypothetical protein